MGPVLLVTQHRPTKPPSHFNNRQAATDNLHHDRLSAAASQASQETALRQYKVLLQSCRGCAASRRHGEWQWSVQLDTEAGQCQQPDRAFRRMPNTEPLLCEERYTPESSARLTHWHQRRRPAAACVAQSPAGGKQPFNSRVQLRMRVEQVCPNIPYGPLGMVVLWNVFINLDPLFDKPLDC
jgi:hypothetical protein